MRQLQLFGPCHLQGLWTRHSPPTSRAPDEDRCPHRPATPRGPAPACPLGPRTRCCQAAAAHRDQASHGLSPQHLLPHAPPLQSVQEAQAQALGWGAANLHQRNQSCHLQRRLRAPHEDAGLAVTCRQAAQARDWQLRAPCKPRQVCGSDMLGLPGLGLRPTARLQQPHQLTLSSAARREWRPPHRAGLGSETWSLENRPPPRAWAAPGLPSPHGCWGSGAALGAEAARGRGEEPLETAPSGTRDASPPNALGRQARKHLRPPASCARPRTASGGPPASPGAEPTRVGEAAVKAGFPTTRGRVTGGGTGGGALPSADTHLLQDFPAKLGSDADAAEEGSVHRAGVGVLRDTGPVRAACVSPRGAAPGSAAPACRNPRLPRARSLLSRPHSTPAHAQGPEPGAPRDCWALLGNSEGLAAQLGCKCLLLASQTMLVAGALHLKSPLPGASCKTEHTRSTVGLGTHSPSRHPSPALCLRPGTRDRASARVGGEVWTCQLHPWVPPAGSRPPGARCR